MVKMDYNSRKKFVAVLILVSIIFCFEDSALKATSVSLYKLRERLGGVISYAAIEAERTVLNFTRRCG